MNSRSVQFDDFLSLSGRDFTQHRLLVFHGVSGSGKSTAISWLLEKHKSFAGKSSHWLYGPSIPHHWPRSDVAVVDEICRARDLVLLWRLLRATPQVLVASHLPPICFAPFRALGPMATFATDRSFAKIERALTRRGIASSDVAVRRFIACYRSNYTDLDIVLEHSPSHSFDAALARFQKLCHIRHTPCAARKPASVCTHSGE